MEETLHQAIGGELIDKAEFRQKVQRVALLRGAAPVAALHHGDAPFLLRLGFGSGLELCVEAVLQPGLENLLCNWRGGFVPARVADIRKGSQHSMRALPLGVDVLGGVQPGEQRPDPWRILDFLLDSLDARKHRVLAQHANHEPPSHGRVLTPEQAVDQHGSVHAHSCTGARVG